MANLLTGDTVIEFTLPATDGQRYSAHEMLTASKALVVVFMSNDCSYVQAWEDRVNTIASEYAAQDVRVLAINANTGSANTMENMGKRAIEKEYVFPYAADETQIVTHAFGAEQTPEVFIFDASAKLRYHGAIDDNYEHAQAAKQHFVREALNALITDNEVTIPETKTIGCPIR